MDISPSDTIYVKRQGGLNKLGDGFSSEEEIKEEIESQYNYNAPGEYTYGVFQEVGEVEFEEPEPKEKTFSETTLGRLGTIESRAEEDERVESFGRIDNPRYNTHVTIYTHKIRYEDNQVDFSITLDNDLFDDVPVSTIDEEVESKIRDLFHDIVGEHGVYLGYNSSYASRGRRNPFVRVVGRVKRDTEKDRTIRSLADLRFVTGLYWSSDNISPVKSYMLPKYNWDDKEDIITVFDINDSADSFDELAEDTLEKVEWNVAQIEEDTNLECMWVGQVSFNRDYSHTCAGFKWIDD